MVTAIYSLNRVNGAEVMLISWLICAMAYIIFCLLRRENRTTQGIKDVFRYLFAAEIVTDIIWALLYYEDGRYVNYGLSSVYGVLIWPVVLLTAGIFVTMQNSVRHSSQ